MTAPLSVASFRAQEVLEPLYNIALHQYSTKSLARPELLGFHPRFMTLVHIIKFSSRWEDVLNNNLVQLLESCCWTDNAVSQENPYPSLSLLAKIWSNRSLDKQQRPRAVLNEINIHWGVPQHQERLLTEMDNYSQEGDTEGMQPRHPIFEARRQADHMFRALDNCRKACSCSHSAQDYSVRLALETYNNGGKAPSPTFMLHILTDPSNRTWQEASVETVPHPIKVAHPDHSDVDIEYQPVKELCGLAKKSKFAETPLPLKVEKEKLLWKDDLIRPRYGAARLKDPTSLKTLIETRGNLGERLELTVAIKLAHAALHFERGPWMKTTWDKQTIQFFHVSDGVIPPQPFLLTRISSEDIPHQESQTKAFHHPDAGLLALGIMLLELRVGQTIESLTASGQAGNGEMENRNPLMIAWEVYKKFKDGFSKGFQSAIESCLNRSFGGPPERRVSDEVFSKRISEKIIAPLEREFAHLCCIQLSSRDFENALQDGLQNVLKKPQMASIMVSAQSPTSKSESHSADNSTDRKLGQNLTTALESRFEEQCQAADDFMRKQLDMYGGVIKDVRAEQDEIKAREPPELHEHVLNSLRFPQTGYRIRIAVLDTGINPQQNLIPDIRIKDIRTWLDGADGDYTPDGEDEDGHGTHVAHLIMRVAHDSDLYVARIAQHGVLENLHQISKAVMYAVKEWKVDIITMSFGITEEDEPGFEELRNSLNEAHCAGVLLFAAASNGGVGRHRTFPARHPVVFCVHGADGSGKPSYYNPTSEKRQLNLSTLSDAVDTGWPSHIEHRNSPLARISGTSFATPIAAAFAAVVLLYARQRLSPDDAKRFKWHEKMWQVFEQALRRFESPFVYEFISLEMIFDIGEHKHMCSRLEAIARGF